MCQKVLINKKLSKLGLKLINVDELSSEEQIRRLTFFNEICEILSNFQVMDNEDYRERREVYFENNLPDPFEFIPGDHLCRMIKMNDNNKIGRCILQIRALEDRYYGHM